MTLGLRQPTVSQHLKVLKDAGLVRVRPDAQRRLYAVDPDGFDVIELWLERRVEPEHRLGYIWGWSYQEFELHEDGDGATYAFVQNGLTDRGEDADEEGLAAGWHEFFDRLDDHLDQVSRTEEEHTARWHELKPSYREQLDRVVRNLG